MSASFVSLSPLDGSPVWTGEESLPAEIDAVMQTAAERFDAWRTKSLERRIDVIRNYAAVLQRRHQEASALLTREVGKLSWEADAEVRSSIAKADLAIRAQQSRTAEVSLDAGDVERLVRYRPLGATLVLGPFNFPLHLPGGQIIPALLAGNTVVFKPSEKATAIGELMVEMWTEAGLPADVLQLIVGGTTTAKRAIDSEHVSGVFVTASRAAGEAIHRQLAGRPEVLLALELGGNNPVVVCPDAPPEIVGPTLSFSAFVSSGQRCTCARRAILVQSSSTDEQISALVSATESLRAGLPGGDPAPDLGPLISAAAVDALSATYDRLLRLGCRPRLPLKRLGSLGNLVGPAIVDASKLDPRDWQEVGALEWFGPLLVLRVVPDLESAIEAAGATPYGLAAAMWGGTREQFQQFVHRVGAGVVHWNRPTTGAAGVMPFGGLGASGNHRPAGYFAADFCSDPITSLQADTLSASDPWNVGR